MTQRSVAHTSFVIERELAAPPEAVFRAWSDAEAKRRWTDCHPDTIERSYSLDFRPGGSETSRMVTSDGVAHHFQAYYFDIVANERIVYAYDIIVGERRLSASLVTVELVPSGKGTRMLFTEQAAFLDGYQDPEERIHGTREGFDRLALEVQESLPMQ